MFKTIVVTDNDIKQGCASSCTRCPVARAIKRVMLQGNVQVFSKIAHFYNTTESRNETLPGQAQDFIRNFDNFHPVLPFQFQLNIPDIFLHIPEIKEKI